MQKQSIYDVGRESGIRDAIARINGTPSHDTIQRYLKLIKYRLISFNGTWEDTQEFVRGHKAGIANSAWMNKIPLIDKEEM